MSYQPIIDPDQNSLEQKSEDFISAPLNEASRYLNFEASLPYYQVQDDEQYSEIKKDENPRIVSEESITISMKEYQELKDFKKKYEALKAAKQSPAKRNLIKYPKKDSWEEYHDKTVQKYKEELQMLRDQWNENDERAKVQKRVHKLIDTYHDQAEKRDIDQAQRYNGLSKDEMK